MSLAKTAIEVAIVGATGESGRCILNGLLQSTNQRYMVTALARPYSISKPGYARLETRGVKVVAVDLHGPQELIIKALQGIDVVIASLPVECLGDQIPLARAAKEAGVMRFVPSAYAMIVPPKGVVDVQDMKTEIVHEIKNLHLPYTIIDVGWWYAGFVPRLPSGRTDYMLREGRENDENMIPGDGNTQCCMVDSRDIGHFVARIIADPRTLNKMVLATGQTMSLNELYDVADELSGEKAERTHMSAESIITSINHFRELIKQGKTDYFTKLGLYWMQYLYSSGIRGDNTLEYAEYLGYVKASDLYPDFKPTTYREFLKEVLEGKARKPYSSD